MNKDELILEIIEKVHEQVQTTSAKVDELQQEQARHGILHEVNALNLEKHMARTEAAEERLAVIEKHFMFVGSAIKVITGLSAIVVFSIKVIPFILHLLQK